MKSLPGLYLNIWQLYRKWIQVWLSDSGQPGVREWTVILGKKSEFVSPCWASAWGKALILNCSLISDIISSETPLNLLVNSLCCMYFCKTGRWSILHWSTTLTAELLGHGENTSGGQGLSSTGKEIRALHFLLLPCLHFFIFVHLAFP